MKRVIAAIIVISMVFASTAIAATTPPIADRVACVAAGANPRITATVPSTLSTPRVFFRANGEPTEYYVDMRRSAADPNRWFAILPALEPSTKTITYRVAAVDDSKSWIVSGPITVTATSSCPATLTPEEQVIANGIVLGLTTASQSDVPPGFSCRGVTNVIGVDGRMRPAEGCRRLLAQGLTGVAAAGTAATLGAAGAAGAAAAAATAGVLGTGLSAAALAGLAAAGLAAGVAIRQSNQDSTARVSNSRP